MTSRELPSVEWYRLIGHPCMQGADIPTGAAADNARCAVVEDNGEIVAVVWAVSLVFMDGFWVDPLHRQGTAGKRAYDALRQILDTTATPTLHCFAPTPEHAGLLERLGFTPLPLLTLSLPCQQPSPSQPSLPSPPQGLAI